jgi:membrane-associated phospholipid phosphatase
MIMKLVLFFLLISPLSLISQNIDIRLLRAINSPETLPSDKFFQFVSNSEVYIIIGVPAGMTATGLLKQNENLVRNAGMTFIATAINFGVTTALKYSIQRDRPYVTYPDITKKSAGGSPSFPSGHTSGAFATATSVSLAYPKWFIIVPSYAWAGTVGYSRMHLGVHYPSDVIAGALIGTGSAYLTYKINKKLIRNKRTKPCNCPGL